MKTESLVCKECGIIFNKALNELNRQRRKGKEKFFCSIKCASLHNNSPLGTGEKSCELCGNVFVHSLTNIGKKTRFCSRECASRGSVTQKRIDASKNVGARSLSIMSKMERLRMIALGLLSREGNRYTEISEYLNKKNINYNFEYIIENYIYDLVLHDLGTVVEFDEGYHSQPRQKEIDKERDVVAIRNGWKIIRIKTESKSKIPITSISNLF